MFVPLLIRLPGIFVQSVSGLVQIVHGALEVKVN